ncbi:aquaporin AQPAe.a-like [Diaphorina citri]|uniref:Aquaporin AQPAe.a-like n=1 Tax=Diaphorina citri TaxID=121845 RepID=A0A3Q0IVS1_DIACI|nr:aquaporin AQPAe.a-like [Diaphorina citri]
MKFNTDRVLESVRTLKIINKNGDVDLESNNGSYQVNNNNARDRTNEKDETSQDRCTFIHRALEICLAEILGTFGLMFFGCMSCIGGFSQGSVPSLQPALMFGFVVSTIITIFGHISSAHLNPSVTVAAFMLGDISVADALVYVMAQLIGAVLGYATLGVVTPHDVLTFGVSPDKGLCSTNQGYVYSNPNFQGPYTGASMNAARSIAPAFINNIWTKQWIYWTAPTLAGTVTPLIYTYAFERKRLEKQF